MRRLPFRVVPIEGEFVASYVERLAAECGASIMHTLHTLGVVESPRQAALPSGWGIDLPAEIKATLADGTGLAIPDVDAMLLRRYDQIAMDLRGFDPDDPHTSTEIGKREWVYVVGSHLCPLCLAEDGAWQLAWKLPWSFVCLRHGVLLVDTCPSCEGRIGCGRRRLARPAFATAPARPGFCTNPRVAKAKRRRSGSFPCGYALSEITSLPVALDGLVASTQDSLLAVIEGTCPEPTVAGIPVRPKDYFNDLRLISSWLRARSTSPDALASVDAPFVDAFCRWINERDGRRAQSGLSHARVRSYEGVPQSAALMGAVAATAVEILALPSTEAIADRLWLLDDLGSRSGRQFVSVLLSRLPMSGPLRTALEVSFARDSPYPSMRGSLRYRGKAAESSPRGIVLRPEAIPLLIWEETFDDLFSEHFPVRANRVARRFCSLSLAKVVVHGSWGDAAEALHRPRVYSRLATHQLQLLNRKGRTGAFFASVADLAANPGRELEGIDYRSREQEFQDWEFDINTWRWVTTRRLGPPTPLRVLPAASAWVWARLTGLDWRDAPTLADFCPSGRRLTYKRFERRYLPLLREDLLALERMLTGRGTGLAAARN